MRRHLKFPAELAMPHRTVSRNTYRYIVIAMCLGLVAQSGCSRRFWRQQAERDTYEAVSRKLNDPHWTLPRIDLKPDSRSRFYDPWDPDCEPLPPDDPAAHQSMHSVSGRRGYKSWHKLGTALSIENPHWLSSYSVLMDNADPVHGHSQVTMENITLQQAIELAYIHSRTYQTAIEDLYLTALSVTQQEFNLGVRYAGPGVRVPGFTGGLTDNPGGADTFGLNPRLGASQLLPAGTQLAAELANNTLWLFGGGTSNSASTLAFSLTQPLLFRAGRKVVLEGLTQADRNVLYAARDLARFRQRLFTDVTTGFLQLQQQLQRIRNLESNIRQLEDQIEIRLAEDRKQPSRIGRPLASFPANVELPESLAGLLRYDAADARLLWTGPMSAEQRDAIRSLSDEPDYQAAAASLIRDRDHEVTSQSFAQLLTQLNGQRNQLEDANRRLADLTDAFKIILGLPPNISMTVDDSQLNQFTLIDPKTLMLDRNFRDLATQLGPTVIPEDGESEQNMDVYLPEIREYLASLTELRTQLATEMAAVAAEFVPVRKLLSAADSDASSIDSGSTQRQFTSDEEAVRVREDVDGDQKLFSLISQDFRRATIGIEMIVDTISSETFPASLDTNADGSISPQELPSQWTELPNNIRQAKQSRTYNEVIIEARNGLTALREELLKITQSVQVVQAGLRVEKIATNRFVLPGEKAFPTIEKVIAIGMNRRRDLMNVRAQVMDARRRIEVAASELETTLDVTFNGQIGTGDDSRKPFNFDNTAAQYNAGLQLDTPSDKMAERNNYNAVLIDYQRARRDYMAFEDEIKREIRQSWRQLKVSEQRLEIDRQAVRVAALQYDIAATNANAPGQNNALSLLNALDAVLAAQNSLLGDWTTYELNRLNIYRDMGIMEIDNQGLWSDPFYVDYTVADSGPADLAVAPPEYLSSLAAEPPRSTEALPVLNFDTEDGE